MIEFMLFDIATRRLLPSFKTVSTWEMMDMQTTDEHGVVFGHWPLPENYYVAEDFFTPRLIGDGGPDDPGPVTISSEQSNG